MHVKLAFGPASGKEDPAAEVKEDFPLKIPRHSRAGQKIEFTAFGEVRHTPITELGRQSLTYPVPCLTCVIDLLSDAVRVGCSPSAALDGSSQRGQSRKDHYR